MRTNELMLYKHMEEGQILQDGDGCKPRIRGRSLA